jgi:hypothetical protein
MYPLIGSICTGGMTTAGLAGGDERIEAEEGARLRDRLLHRSGFAAWLPVWLALPRRLLPASWFAPAVIA